jgi:hypothetical protein
MNTNFEINMQDLNLERVIEQCPSSVSPQDTILLHSSNPRVHLPQRPPQQMTILAKTAQPRVMSIHEPILKCTTTASKAPQHQLQTHLKFSPCQIVQGGISNPSCPSMSSQLCGYCKIPSSYTTSSTLSLRPTSYVSDQFLVSCPVHPR